MRSGGVPTLAAVKDVVSAFKFLVANKGVGMRGLECGDLAIQATALLLRPTGFAEDALEPFLDLAHNGPRYAAALDGAS